MKIKPMLPFLLIGTGGIVLILAAIFLFRDASQPKQPHALLPPALSGIALTEQTLGPEAIAGVIELHGVDFPLSDAAIGVYGSQSQATLWISVEPDTGTAAQLTDQMTEKINAGRSPFTLPTISSFAGKQVYALTGLGQQHYYWQAGELVIWLSVNSEIATQALQECLAYYP
jgi:hypothetical protein